jgi:hypothetical protein
MHIWRIEALTFANFPIVIQEMEDIRRESLLKVKKLDYSLVLNKKKALRENS